MIWGTHTPLLEIKEAWSLFERGCGITGLFGREEEGKCLCSRIQFCWKDQEDKSASLFTGMRNLECVRRRCFKDISTQCIQMVQFFRMHYKTVEKGTYFPISIQSPTAILPRYYQQLGQSYLLPLGGQHHDNFSHICTSWITDHYHCFQVGSGHHRHQTAHLSNVNEQQQ